LHLLKAELAMINGQEEVALEAYQQASRLGRAHPAAIVRHVQLLVARGRFAEAKIVVERIPKTTRQRLLGRLYSEILFSNGILDEAMESAEIVISSDPTDAIKQLWYGQLMARAAQSEELSEEKRKECDVKAGEAIQRAVELNPSLQEGWLALVSYHVYHQNKDQAEQALREAQLALSSERLPVVLAKCYELMGRVFDAENLYRTAYETEPDNVALARQLATFYLGPNNRLSQQDKFAKVTPLLNGILKAGAEGKLEASDAHLLWARRTSAKMLAQTGDYQNLLKAEKLLASNSIDGQLQMEDRLQMAQILATRPEPISRRKAATLLEEAKEQNRLNLSAELILGQLYFALGDWRKCQQQMTGVIGHYSDVPVVRDAYIRMLLKKDAASRTKQHLEKLIEIAPNQMSTLELIAIVFARLDRRPQARTALLRALPGGGDLTKLTDEQLPIAEKIADLLADELDDEETAFKIYQYLVSRDANKVYKLAEFIGQRREVSECIELLDRVYKPELAPSVMQVALKVVRHRREDVGDQFDPQIQSWLDRGLREYPDLATLWMQQAEFLEIQENYTDAVAAYRKILDRKDLQGVSRAIVLNNLSYLLALKDAGSGTSEAMQLVREAVNILGPTADILDTRAMVFISKKQFEDAIADLELSLTDNPTASKYFHMTVATLGANKNADALFAWDEAVKLGLSRDNVSPLERSQFDSVKDKIEQLQATSADYDDEQPLGDRRRGENNYAMSAR
jgi:tetratricopeptide (TPR) repeat protein